MALLPTKTYSKRNKGLFDREKENIDPFDKLLSSPLKQDVQFQPLSFWGKNIKDIESKKKSRNVKFGLYETSDSDEHSSPFQKIRKPKCKSLISKRIKSKSMKLSSKRNANSSTAHSLIEKTKPHMSTTPIETTSFINIEESQKNGSRLLNKTLCPNENMEETLISTYMGHDNFKCDKLSCFNPDGTTESFYCFSKSFQPKESKKNSSKINFEKIVQKNLTFTIYEDLDLSPKQSINDEDKSIVKEESVDSSVQFDESVEETLKPFYDDQNSFKFINVKRQFDYPNFYFLPDENFNSTLNLIGSLQNQKCSKSSCNSKVESYKDISMSVDCVNDDDKINFIEDVNDDEYFINNSQVQISNKNINNSLNSVISKSIITEGSKAKSLQKCQCEKFFLDRFDFMSFKNNEFKDLIQELPLQKNAKIQNSTTEDLSATLDDTQSEPEDDDTVIGIALESETNPTSSQGFKREETVRFVSPPSGVSQLTTRISDLIISNTIDKELSESEVEKLDTLQCDPKNKDKEDSFLIDLRNVTTKRRGFLCNKYGEKMLRTKNSRFRSSAVSVKLKMENNSETESEYDQTLTLPPITERISLDWNKTASFTNPIFESTRVLDRSLTDRKVSQGQNLSDTVFEESAFEYSYVLKPGKKWLRSICVLKQLENGNISEGRLENTRVTGRNFESFVQGIVKLQTANSKISNKTCAGVNVENSFSEDLSGYLSIVNFQDESEIKGLSSVNDSVLTKSSANKTVTEKVLLNRTVKVIEPEENSSAFRNALGLETSCVTIQEESIQEENSCFSAKDFILMQCGQEDFLPFEEYFNERTLINCKKIGEGVYGEVFMCSDTVIKIIPIEGSDKVNGEPQKTFEEIISEVVIASKLSNLRYDRKYQTDGFSEMKRCWCVKGKYPKHLLHLWNDYDQLGSGSENDSPVMFKDDQLYIILELANGGKDLESFVFSSAAQSLSVFIQTAFSLAIAEKAFEFEHRDLHWGNVLISETKDKFITVVLDGTEHKIPSKGVKVCIIDFTLSRINHEGCCIFNDLSVDPGLFTSEGDYQFEIYRMMLREVKNDWSLFRPKNNLFWLHYILDKMIKMVRYKSKKSKIHAKHLKDLKTLESAVLEYKDSTNFVLSNSLSSMINKL